ncbi:hypothetical protein [Chryseobacterium foetidum]|uniref:hypothetical protein n=1 Tax=Chryseobacterium foetidum TaxID=2951057 RepID=UPI0021C8564A|nr:hypothetical protein [Chryseobacterium foetidum]
MIIRPVLPFISYAVNYDYITKELCENKDKPELLCKGKCYLTKELAKTAQGQVNKSSQKINLNSIDVFVIIEEFNDSFTLISQLLRENISVFNTDSYNSIIYNKLFRPPSV